MLYFTWKLTGLKGAERVLYMSFAVVRMAKMKSHDLKGIQFHNQREKESKTNLDIDKTKAHLNYEIHNIGPIDYNKQVKKIIDSQKIGERKTRKDAVLINELLVTSNKDFFDNLSPEDENRFFKESYKLFSERYGQQNIVYATIHKDEKTPHMHLGVVPMLDGRLQGKNVFNRKELLWIQNEFPKHMQSLGFDLERGEKGSDRTHIETQRFKATTLQNEIETLQNNHETLQNGVSVLQLDVDKIQKAVDAAKAVQSIQAEKGGVFDRGSVKMPAEDFKALITKAKATEVIELEVLKTLELANSVENRSIALSNEIKVLKNENKYLKKENAKLLDENTNLQRTIDGLKRTVTYLQKTLENIKNQSQNLLAVAKEKMQEFVGIARAQSMLQEFGDTEFGREAINTIVPQNEKLGAEKILNFLDKKKKEHEAERSALEGFEVENAAEESKIEVVRKGIETDEMER